jgi:hypothetical protein
MIINIICLIIASFWLYRNRLTYYTDKSNIQKSDDNIYNNFLWGTLSCQAVINIIVHIINCSNNIGEIGLVILYTFIAWISFIIVVYFKQYLRVPMANVFGYIWYAHNIKINLNDQVRILLGLPLDSDLFELSSSFILTDNGWKTNMSTKSIQDVTLNEYITNLLQIYCKRDLIGEFVLFVLTGLMCIFISEYIIINNTCNNKKDTTISL